MGIEEYNKFKKSYDAGARRPIQTGGATNGSKREVGDEEGPAATVDEMQQLQKEFNDMMRLPEQSKAMGELNRQIASQNSDEAYLNSTFEKYGLTNTPNKNLRDARVEKYKGAIESSKPATTAGDPSASKNNPAVQAIGGVANFAQSVANLGVEIADFVDNNIGSGHMVGEEDKFTFADEMFPESDYAANKLLRGAVQFIVPYAGIAKGLKAAQMGGMAAGALAGVAADLVAFEGDDDRISNLIQDIPALQNPVTEFLAAKKEDPALVGRVKNAIEGAMLGVGLAGLGEGVFKTLRLVKAKKTLKAAEEMATGVDNGVIQLEPTTITATPVEGKIDVPPVEEQAKTLGDIASAKPPEVTPEELIAPNPGKDKGGGYKLNLERIDASDDVLSVIKNVAEKDKAEIEKVLGDPLRTKELQERATKAGVTLDKVLGKKATEGFNAEELYVLRTSVANGAAEIKTLATQAAESGDPKLAAEVIKKVGSFNQIYRALGVGKSRAAQTLSSLKAPVKAEEMASQLDQIIQVHGEARVFKLIDQIANMPEDKIAEATAKTTYRRLFDAFQETYVSNLLAGVSTQVTNFVSSPFMFATQVTERAMAPIMGKVLKTEAESVSKLAIQRSKLLEQRLDPSLSFDKSIEIDTQLEGINSKLGQALQSGVEPGEATQMVLGFFDGVKEGFQLLSKDFKGLMSKGEAIGRVSKTELNFDPAVSSKNLGGGKVMDILGATQRASLTALSAVDNFWKIVFNRAELNATAYRLGRKQGLSGDDLQQFIKSTVDNPPPFISEEGKQFAQLTTFTNPLEGIAKNFDEFTKSDVPGRVEFLKAPHLKVLFPFVRTPMNIAIESFERTPLGALRLLGGRYNTIMSEGGTKAQLLKSKVALGNTAFAIAGLYAANGYITGGGPRDPRKQAMLKETGWQPYSVKIGDKYLPLKNAGPMGAVIGLAADVAEIAGASNSDGPNPELGDIAAMLSFSLLERGTPEGMIKNMGYLFESIERQDASFLTRIAANGIPLVGYAREAREVIDPIRRVVDPGKEAEFSALVETVNRIKDSIPGLSSTLPAVKNIFGEPIQLPTPLGEDGVTAFFGVKPEKNDPLLKEIVRLGYYGPLKTAEPDEGESHLSLSMPAKSIERDGVSVDLTPQQYDRFVDLAAGKGLRGAKKTLREFLKEVVIDQSYKNKSDERKRLEILNVVKTYRDAARDQMIFEDESIENELRKGIKRRGEAIRGTR